MQILHNCKYRIYPNHPDISTYQINLNKYNLLPDVVSKKHDRWVANSVDPDETPQNAASHLGLHCLLRPVFPNTYGIHGKLIL